MSVNSYADILKIRPFRDLWLGQSISQVGDSLYYVAFMFMVKKITGSSAMVGYVGALEVLPYLLIGPYVGVVADRHSRKKIMLSSDLLSAAVLLAFGVAILFCVAPPAWSILLLAFALSTVRCFFLPAKSAAIPALVPGEKLLTANALSMTTQTIMPIFGLLLSALVLAALYDGSPQWFFIGTVVVNAASFLGSAYFISRLPKMIPDRTDLSDTHPFADTLSGFRYVRNRHDLKVLIGLLIVFRLSVAPFFVAYVVANDQWWGGAGHHGRPQTLALIELVFFVGMVIASARVGKLTVTRPARWFCTGLGLVGVTVSLMAFSSNVWVFAGWNFIAGLGLPVAEIPINTYCQLSVEDGFRGRTNALINMIANVAAPIGLALAGILIARIGLSTMFLAMGIGMAAAAFGGLADRRFRDVVMPTTPV